MSSPPFFFRSPHSLPITRMRLPRFSGSWRYSEEYSSFIFPPSSFVGPVAESTRCHRLQLRGQWRVFTAFPTPSLKVVDYRRTSCTGVMRGTPENGCASTKTLTAKTSLSSSGVNTSLGCPKATVFPSFISKTQSENSAARFTSCVTTTAATSLRSQRRRTNARIAA